MKAKFLKILLVLVLFTSFLSVLPISNSQEEPKSGNITFQPNVIPFLKIHFVEEFFRFQWNANRFDLKLLIAHNDSGTIKELSLRAFWEKTDKVVKWKKLVNKATESMYEFGYNITDIPQEIADNVEYLIWKIEGASFDVSEIEVEVLSDLPNLAYNITRFHLPNNLVLSYEDLRLYNFTVSHPNKLETKIEGVKGKSVWNLDPITYSSPIITVIGGTAGSPLNYTDIWVADQAGGWNVVHNNNNTNTQFEFNARIILGNGTVAGTTYFSDGIVQITFGDNSFTANYQVLIDVKNKASFIMGILISATDKTTRNGASILSAITTYTYPTLIQANSGSTVYIYGSYLEGNFDKKTGINFISTSTTRVYETNLQNVRAQVRGSDFYKVNIREQDYCIYYSTGTFEDVFLHDPYYGWLILLRYGGTIKNLVGRADASLNPQAALRAYLMNVDTNLVNADLYEWTISWLSTSTGEIYRQYEFDLNVTDSANSPIQNANVTVSHYGEGETQDFSILTGANGSFTTQTLTMGFYNQTGGNTIYDYNPYNLTIIASGYATKTFNFTLEEKTDWQVTLEPPTAPTVSTTTYMLQGILLFSPIMLAIALSRRNKAKR